MNILRLVVFLLATALAGAAFPTLAEYPDKPVKIIVPYPPAGTTDILARLIAARLSERMKQPFVIENRPGAGTNIGAAAAARAAPDGYTLLMATSSTMAINSSIYKTLPFDPLKDLMPVVLYARVPFVLIVNPSSPAQTAASSSSPRTSPARSASAPRAPERRRTCSPNCSRCKPASRSRMCPTRAWCSR